MWRIRCRFDGRKDYGPIGQERVWTVWLQKVGGEVMAECFPDCWSCHVKVLARLVEAANKREER